MAKKQYAKKNDILSDGGVPDVAFVDVKGFSKPIRMGAISFSELMRIQESASDKEEYAALLVAGSCLDIDIDTARELQKNGTKFALLFGAANEFCNKITDENIKN